MDESRFDTGMRIRREVLGDQHVDQAQARQTSFDADFQRFITETAWGTLWARPDLDRRTRSTREWCTRIVPASNSSGTTSPSRGSARASTTAPVSRSTRSRPVRGTPGSSARADGNDMTSSAAARAPPHRRPDPVIPRSNALGSDESGIVARASRGESDLREGGVNPEGRGRGGAER